MINSIKFVNTLTHDRFPPWQCGFAFIAWRDENHNRVIEHNGFDYVTEEDVEVLESMLEMVKYKAEENKRFSGIVVQNREKLVDIGAVGNLTFDNVRTDNGLLKY